MASTDFAMRFNLLLNWSVAELTFVVALFDFDAADGISEVIVIGLAVNAFEDVVSLSLSLLKSVVLNLGPRCVESQFLPGENADATACSEANEQDNRIATHIKFILSISPRCVLCCDGITAAWRYLFCTMFSSVAYVER